MLTPPSKAQGHGAQPEKKLGNSRIPEFFFRLRIVSRDLLGGVDYMEEIQEMEEEIAVEDQCWGTRCAAGSRDTMRSRRKNSGILGF